MSTTGRALLVALAAVLLVTGDALLAPAGGQEQYTKAPAEAHKGYSIVPVGLPVMEKEEKAWFAGRTIFKIPPAPPCRANANAICC
ncbi:hypothetical protein OsI_27380 [Oryza sativa Indica Group]|nr:hypothetical protein OsI_27380 [Oryza sativa Indica Group]